MEIPLIINIKGLCDFQYYSFCKNSQRVFDWKQEMKKINLTTTMPLNHDKSRVEVSSPPVEFSWLERRACFLTQLDEIRGLQLVQDQHRPVEGNRNPSTSILSHKLVAYAVCCKIELNQRQSRRFQRKRVCLFGLMCKLWRHFEHDQTNHPAQSY